MYVYMHTFYILRFLMYVHVLVIVPTSSIYVAVIGYFFLSTTFPFCATSLGDLLLLYNTGYT